ncbi:MAG: GNAT family N-acetyltransferase [Armatimonadetes bacterium]|nr:GNAT family N-acetyltransferase [Armatimonadota bacterium]
MREVTVTFLEMKGPPAGPPPDPPEGTLVMESLRSTAAFYRFLYRTVGGPWEWTDRESLSDSELETLLAEPEVHLYVLYSEGTPAGYAELDFRYPPDFQLAYFGLVPAFIGRRLGSFFLRWTVHQAFRLGVGRLCVNTCTLDHPAALPLYQKAGFREVEKKIVLRA